MVEIEITSSSATILLCHPWADINQDIENNKRETGAFRRDHVCPWRFWINLSLKVINHNTGRKGFVVLQPQLDYLLDKPQAYQDRR